MITVEEEALLAQRIRQGDKCALEKLVNANLRFAVSVAKQYQNLGNPLPDLINDANLGLHRAAQDFDETKGFKFISYAVWWVRQSVIEGLTTTGRMIRLPQSSVSLSNKITEAIRIFEQYESREPEDEELMEILGVEKKKLELTMAQMDKSRSLDEEVFLGEEGATLLDMQASNEPEPDKELSQELSLKETVRMCLVHLAEQEREIIEYVFGLNGKPELTLEAIGEKIDLTKERVRQIKQKAIKNLQRPKYTVILAEYL